jgi:predicted metalloprotease with PDZ domain
MSRPVCLALAAAFSLAAFASAQTGQPDASYLRALAGRPGLPVMHYTLDLTHPNDHLAAVTLVAPASHPATRIQLPAWYPGRYSIYNFAVNVQQAAAFCDAGDQPLPFHRVDPNTWQVDNGSCRRIRWQYRVYGNTPLNGSFFQVDATHANLNGGPVYMYPDGDKPNPVELDIRVPQGWKVLNELGQLNQTHLWFPNYDIFIDAPTEAAPNFTLDQFQADGKTYRVLIHDYATADSNAANRKALLDGLEKLVKTENAVVAPDELDTYTFFFHFDPGSSDGMEHLFGTQIMIPAGLGAERGLQGAFDDAAHEFFHQWNIKRIRPAALGPWNYEAINPTPSLWVGEGFTQYYGDISVERAGLQTADDYLASLGRSLGNSLTAPAYRLMSAEDSSLTAWFHDATPLRQQTNTGITTISYYGRGEQIAAVLDLDLRERSGGKKSLNDVMRWLWKNTYHAPRATYYLPGRGYTDLDVEHAAEAVAGASYASFFREYVAGTQLINYDQYLAGVGLQLSCSAQEGTNSFSGLYLAGDRVRGVAPGSPAEAAGFGNDMVLVSINGEKLPEQSAPAASRGRGFSAGPSPVDALPAGQPASVVVTAHGATLTLTLTPAAAHATSCKLVDAPGATAAQKSLRAAWLAGR